MKRYAIGCMAVGLLLAGCSSAPEVTPVAETAPTVAAADVAGWAALNAKSGGKLQPYCTTALPEQVIVNFCIGMNKAHLAGLRPDVAVMPHSEVRTSILGDIDAFLGGQQRFDDEWCDGGNVLTDADCLARAKVLDGQVLKVQSALEGAAGL